jgi:spore cortex formation protein SpoVR/YcgB (stage V sporulation)
MTTRGTKQTPWTTSEIAYLQEHAGKVRVTDICAHLNRSHSAVIHQACRQGVSLRFRERVLVWCDCCATWRSTVDENGRCEVCALTDRIHALQENNSAEYRRMNHAQRVTYEEKEALREEAAEIKRLTREANRIKKETQRVREATGRNPRKG